MKKILLFLISIVILSSCDKPDRVDHQDKDYIYVWQYDGNDSSLVKFNQPRYVRLNVYGGHHKNHHIKVDFYDGTYRCYSLSSHNIPNRCELVDKAQMAYHKGQPIVGIFKEIYYPHHDYIFIKYE